MTPAPPGPVRTPYAPPRGEVPVLFEDETLAVADKPAGLLTVPGRGVEKADCLVSRLGETRADLRIVHRLDMETSGLVILAKGAEAQRRLSAMFEKRAVDKVYIARVTGMMGDAEGTIDLPLYPDWPNRPRQKVDPEQGKPALTAWRKLSDDGEQSRLELRPVTGRTHQLRVHMAAIGHPIVGDVLYGGSAGPRLMLHATALAFPHPLNGAPLRVTTPAPF